MRLIILISVFFVLEWLATYTGVRIDDENTAFLAKFCMVYAFVFDVLYLLKSKD